MNLIVLSTENISIDQLIQLISSAKPEDIAADIATVVSELQAKEIELERKQTMIDQVEQLNADLQLEIEKLGSIAPVVPAGQNTSNLEDYSFEQDGKSYGFNYWKQTYKGQVITPVEVVADAALQAVLINMKSSMIKEKTL